MKTAVSASMIPVGATWGFWDETELRSSGARFIVHHPRELIGIARSDVAVQATPEDQGGLSK